MPRKIKISYKGQRLLEEPHLNKGTAFTRQERQELEIENLLPYSVHTLEKQIQRAWSQYNSFDSDLRKNEFLLSMRDQNIVLFYAILQKYTKKVFPIIYTPTEGEFIAKYSRVFRRPSGGCFLSYPDYSKEKIEAYLSSFGGKDDIDLIVVSDGEEILGIGDQGVGGIGISQAKLMIYTLAAGVHPARTLPVVLDVGTNNQELLDDELYVGWRNKRLTGKEYDDFVDTFVLAVQKLFPKALLHFEDFGLGNARRLLEKYRPKHSVFNDDIQGTGAVTLAALTAAVWITKSKLRDQRIVIYGAGTAGSGIADQIRDAMTVDEEGMNTSKPLTKQEATAQIYCVDKQGLCLDSQDLTSAQKPYAKSHDEISKWGAKGDTISLLEVIKNVKPTILIGASTHAGAFTKDVIEEMSKHVERPIILPLSNPTRLCEVKPSDANEWSKGKALIATGSPFDPVEYDGKKYIVAECNNATCYPGLGMAVIACRASHLSDAMIVAGVKALAELSPAILKKDPDESLLPDVDDLRRVSVHIAAAVVMQAIKEGLARETKPFENKSQKEVEEYLRSEVCWDPVYDEYEYEA